MIDRHFNRDASFFSKLKINSGLLTLQLSKRYDTHGGRGGGGGRGVLIRRGKEVTADARRYEKKICLIVNLNQPYCVSLNSDTRSNASNFFFPFFFILSIAYHGRLSTHLSRALMNDSRTRVHNITPYNIALTGISIRFFFFFSFHKISTSSSVSNNLHGNFHPQIFMKYF